jgi:hypothetical protein
MRRTGIFYLPVIVVAVLSFSSAAKVFGAGGYFGIQEKIKCLQPIKEQEPEKPAASNPFFTVIDPNRVKYNLCYKYSILFFFAGVYLHNDGYVLAEGDDAYRYVPLDAAKIAEYQEKEILPKDLPPYAIPWSQYAIGYSLWLFFIAFTGGSFLWRGFKRWKNKGKKCLKCELMLIDDDFKKGICGNCGEPVPVR